MYVLLRTNHDLKKTASIEIDSEKWALIEQKKLCKTGDLGLVYNKDLPPIDLDVITLFMCLYVKKGLSIERLCQLIDDINNAQRFLL